DLSNLLSRVPNERSN
nr:RecName: Full=46 kDa cell wall protein [Daucus carota]